MKKSMLWLTVCVMTLGVGADAYGAPTGQLYAGTSMANITPTQAQNPVDLSNNSLTLGKDELFARALVLDNGHTSVAIVTLDLILFSSEYVVAEAKSRYGVDHVVLSSSHTHEGMAPEGLVIGAHDPVTGQTVPNWTDMQQDPGNIIDWPALSADPWYAQTEESIITAIGDAMNNKFEASIVSDSGYFQSDYMAHNRRYYDPDTGQVTMYWSKPAGWVPQPTDPTVGFIRIDDASGDARAFMTHYAAHPVTQMWSGDLSRDYPGPMVDRLEAELGEQCMGMFLQGAAGDLDVYNHAMSGQDGWDRAEAEGVELADAALQVAATTTNQSKSSVSIRVSEDLLTLNNRYNGGTTEVGVTTIMIDDDLALVTIPGEPFIEHQLDLRAASLAENTFLMGVTYSGAGSPFLVYVPTAEAAVEGGYGADYVTFVGIGAGEQMVDHAVEIINNAVLGIVDGDANGDGVVDLQDFGILKHYMGTSSGATKAMGDFNGDGSVNLADFVILKANFASSESIPEPTTAALVVFGAVAMIRRRRAA